MNEDNLAKQEESVRKQEAMKRGRSVCCYIVCPIVGVMNGLLRFCSAHQIRLLLVMLAIFWGCLFACACIFLQVLACSVFGGGSVFRSDVVARKTNFCHWCSSSHARICSERPFNAPISNVLLLCQEFSLDMFFRQRWKDPRLAYKPHTDKGPDQRVILSPELSKLVWQPDVYFRNSKEARFHMVPTQNVLFGIGPDGSILLSAR